MALLLFLALGFIEGARVEPGTIAFAERAIEHARSGHQTRFEQVRGYRDVLVGERERLFEGAHARAHLQPHVPQRGDEGVHPGLVFGIRRLGQQDQDVDVGVGIELAAAVAAHGQERRAARQGMGFEQAAQGFVDQVRVAREIARRREGAFEEGARERFAPRGEFVLERGEVFSR